MPSKILIRKTEPEDCNALFDLIKSLADYEKLSHLVSGSASALEEHLFGSPNYAEALLAEKNGQAAGFALFFPNYSTFLTKPGLYLEDIFVLPEHRGCGVGKALLQEVARIAVRRGCGRLDWSVLDWNQPAIDFYGRMGASVMPEWRICRVADESLIRLGKVC
jgi:GNAT superfamily N-acetyltransferase